MKVKIYEGRIYSVVKKTENEDSEVFVVEIPGLYKNDAEFKAEMKARGEKFIGIANRKAIYNTYEISKEIVKQYGILVIDEDYI